MTDLPSQGDGEDAPQGDAIDRITREREFVASVAFYARPWVPDDHKTWPAWTLADCDCEPMANHCPRCDGRRLMLSVTRAAYFAGDTQS